MPQKNPNLAAFCLRIGLAIAFGYAGIGSLLQPDVWIGYLPSFLSQLSFSSAVLTGFGVFELLLTFWILSGWKVKYAAGFAVLMLSGIVISNISDLTIVFRDLALIFSALALFLNS